MSIYTCITNVRQAYHLSQHEAQAPDAALRDHLTALPHDDSGGLFDDELDWLLGITGGLAAVELVHVGHCPNTWLWRDGALHEPQYITYIVKTEPN